MCGCFCVPCVRGVLQHTCRVVTFNPSVTSACVAPDDHLTMTPFVPSSHSKDVGYVHASLCLIKSSHRGPVLDCCSASTNPNSRLSICMLCIYLGCLALQKPSPLLRTSHKTACALCGFPPLCEIYIYLDITWLMIIAIKHFTNLGFGSFFIVLLNVLSGSLSHGYNCLLNDSVIISILLAFSSSTMSELMFICSIAACLYSLLL